MAGLRRTREVIFMSEREPEITSVEQLIASDPKIAEELVVVSFANVEAKRIKHPKTPEAKRISSELAERIVKKRVDGDAI